MATKFRPVRQAFGQRRLPVTIRPTEADVAIARIVARKTGPAPERLARALTWGADEKVLLALTAIGWLASRGAGEPMRRAANHAVLVAAAASLLPHGMKRLVDQTRPDDGRRSSPRGFVFPQARGCVLPAIYSHGQLSRNLRGRCERNPGPPEFRWSVYEIFEARSSPNVPVRTPARGRGRSC
jgi:hypothetical protein